MTPLTHPAKKIDQADSIVLHVQEEVYQSTLILEGEQLATKNDALDPSSQKFDLLVLHIPVENPLTEEDKKAAS